MYDAIMYGRINGGGGGSKINKIIYKNSPLTPVGALLSFKLGSSTEAWKLEGPVQYICCS